MLENITVVFKRYWPFTTFILQNKNTKEIYCSLDVEEECVNDKKHYIPEFCDKNVLYITCFETKEEHRNKGYAKYLLAYVINFFKKNQEKYHLDMLHLNACPYYLEGLKPIYKAPKSGLEFEKLIEFYESFGLVSYKEYDQTTEDKGMVMIMNF